MPLLHEVIPIIDVLTGKLASTIVNEDGLQRIVRIAAMRGLDVINKYYSKTDNSIMYRMALRTFHVFFDLFMYLLTSFHLSSATPPV